MIQPKNKKTGTLSNTENTKINQYSRLFPLTSALLSDQGQPRKLIIVNRVLKQER